MRKLIMAAGFLLIGTLHLVTSVEEAGEVMHLFNWASTVQAANSPSGTGAPEVGAPVGTPAN